MKRDELDEVGSGDIAWPLESRGGDAFLASMLAEVRLARLVSADELRTIGLQLMRCGPPVGWLGALLVMDSNRISGGGDDPPGRSMRRSG